jgi:hypothetical protein
MPQTLIENGTPRELAKRLNRLPEGNYRVLVRRVGVRENAKLALDWLERDIKANPDPAIAGKSDDEVMEMVNAIIDEERASRPA